MKNALLVAATLKDGINDGHKNMGDYIQSLAGEAFFNTIDEYIDREKLAEYKSNSGKTKLIMNAWYMWVPENWPPSEDILPLLISMHFSPFAASRMLTIDGINYLKKYGPVGCRDKATEILLNQYGIPCYFSGCLTLTLGEKYKTHHKKNRILFVDPYFGNIRNEKGRFSIVNSLKCFYFGIINIRKMKRLQEIFLHSDISASRLKKLKSILSFLVVSAFYKTYSSYFDDQLLLNGEYITHSVKIGKNTVLASEEAKLDYARKLIEKYAEASLVVTSRIHCALPCLGLETPVLFVTSERLNSDRRKSDRFGGLLDLFWIMFYKNFSLITNNNGISKKITMDTVINNKQDYIPIKNALLKKCHEFVLQTDTSA
jgi:hypothetical protein